MTRITVCGTRNFVGAITNPRNGYHHRYRLMWSRLTELGDVALVGIDEDAASFGDCVRELGAPPAELVREAWPRRSRRERVAMTFADVVRPDRRRGFSDVVRDAVRRTRPDLVMLFATGHFSDELVSVINDFRTVVVAEEDLTPLPGLGPTSFPARVLGHARERAFAFATSPPAGVVVINERETSWAKRRFGTEQIAVVPLTIDPAYWRPERQASDAGDGNVLAIGHFDAGRNGVWLSKLVEALGRRRDFSGRLRVVTSALPEQGLARDARIVDFLGPVPDPRHEYARVSACVVPSFTVSGTKTTVLQGWSLRCPVVASDPAAASVGGRHGIDLLSAPDPEQLASRLVEAARTHRTDVVEAGEARLASHFSPALARERLSAVLEEVLR